MQPVHIQARVRVGADLALQEVSPRDRGDGPIRQQRPLADGNGVSLWLCVEGTLSRTLDLAQSGLATRGGAGRNVAASS